MSSDRSIERDTELRRARLNIGMRASEVAKTLGLSQQYVSDVELGRRGIPTQLIATFARVYQIDPVHLANLSITLPEGMVIVPATSVPDRAVLGSLRFAVNILGDLVEWSNDGDEWASECLQEMRNNMAIVGDEIHELPGADEVLALIEAWLDAQEGRP